MDKIELYFTGKEYSSPQYKYKEVNIISGGNIVFRGWIREDEFKEEIPISSKSKSYASQEPNCSLPEREKYYPTLSKDKVEINFYETDTSKDIKVSYPRKWFYDASKEKRYSLIQLVSKGIKRSKVHYLMCYRETSNSKPTLVSSNVYWVNNSDILSSENYTRATSKAKKAEVESKKNTAKSTKAKDSSSTSSRGSESRCLSAYQRMTNETENAASAARAGDACRAADGIERALNWLGTCESECSFDPARMRRIAQYKRQLSSTLITYVRACGH